MPEYTTVKQWNVNAFPVSVRDEIIEAAKVYRETVAQYIERAHRLRQNANGMEPMPAPTAGPLDLPAYLDAVTRMHAQAGAPIPKRWLGRVRGYLPPAPRAKKGDNETDQQLKIEANGDAPAQAA